MVYWGVPQPAQEDQMASMMKMMQGGGMKNMMKMMGKGGMPKMPFGK